MKTVKFNEIKGEIEEIYTGKDGCRCGCGGRYFSPGEIGYTRALNKIKRGNPEVAVFESSGESSAHPEAWDRSVSEGKAWSVLSGPEKSGWVDWMLPNYKTVTVYFKKTSG